MLEVKNVDIMVSNRYLIQSLTLHLNKGDKLAVIGEEGNGKSTLLKALLEICEYATITGTIDFKGHTVGYLEQSVSEENLHKKVYDFLFKDDFAYYDKIHELYGYFETLKIDDTILKQVMHTLSGGERVKVSIVKLLLDKYDILLLDEPTNDLDIETLEWLENFMNTIDKPIIYVSHDETLLSRTANMILHIEQIKKKTECRHTLLRMGYDSYVENRLRSIEHQVQISKSERREFNKQQEKLTRVMQKVAYQQNTISRKDPHGAQVLKKKMHSLKAQERKLNNAELTEMPDIEESIHFFFENVKIPSSKVIIRLDIKELKVEGKVLSKNIKLDIIGNIHLCIIGKNGVGKTTLLKQIYEELKTRTDIHVGYMPQFYGDILDQYDNVLDFFGTKDKETLTKVRMYLGNMNFTREEMEGKIKDLSNGTKAKLFLMKFVFDGCNVLLLDEPTRNVSPLSNPVIRKVLKEFKGTIISVSHDRKYMDEVIDELYILSKEGIMKKK